MVNVGVYHETDCTLIGLPLTHASGLVSAGSMGSAEPFEFKWRVLEPVNFAVDILQLIFDRSCK